MPEKKEGEGPLGKYFDIASEDDLFGEKTWELAEGTMQKLACKLALKNAGVQPEEVRYLFGGDLLRQGIATSMGAEELQIPVFGLFGACSTSGEALALAAMTVAAGYGDLVLAATSSHFGSAEKEFRFPLGYANQRPLSSTWTVTGSGAFLVGKREKPVRISGGRLGKLWIRAEIHRTWERVWHRQRHMDCGMTIFDQQTQHTNSGGSGCGCAAITLAAYIMPPADIGGSGKGSFLYQRGR